MRAPLLLIAGCFVAMTGTTVAANVKEFATFGDFRASGDLSDTPNINIAGYAAAGDGAGGQFVLVDPSCNMDKDDDGVTLRNSAGNCFRRQFAGPVHLNWFGATSASPNVSATGIGHAFDDAEGFGNRTVVTDGIAVNYTGMIDLEIPTGDSLDCQGNIGGVSGGGWTIPTLAASIILTPPFKVLADARSTLKNCNIRPNWFTSGTPTDTIRDMIAILRQFSGTGVECTDDGCSIQNVAVYGFDTGIRADESQRFYMNNVVVDSNVGVWWHAVAGASKNTNLLVDPVITQGNPNTEEDWSVTNVSADTNGECKLTLSTSPDDLRTDADTAAAIPSGSMGSGPRLRSIPPAI